MILILGYFSVLCNPRQTQNGLALFAWWVLLEFVVDFGFALTYTGAVKDPLASSIVLAIIVSCAVAW